MGLSELKSQIDAFTSRVTSLNNTIAQCDYCLKCLEYMNTFSKQSQELSETAIVVNGDEPSGDIGFDQGMLKDFQERLDGIISTVQDARSTLADKVVEYNNNIATWQAEYNALLYQQQLAQESNEG